MSKSITVECDKSVVRKITAQCAVNPDDRMVVAREEYTRNVDTDDDGARGQGIAFRCTARGGIMADTARGGIMVDVVIPVEDIPEFLDAIKRML